jgi:hypothetical protein
MFLFKSQFDEAQKAFGIDAIDIGFWNRLSITNFGPP